jgi:hypothetical protein
MDPGIGRKVGEQTLEAVDRATVVGAPGRLLAPCGIKKIPRVPRLVEHGAQLASREPPRAWVLAYRSSKLPSLPSMPRVCFVRRRVRMGAVRGLPRCEGSQGKEC